MDTKPSAVIPAVVAAASEPAPEPYRIKLPDNMPVAIRKQVEAALRASGAKLAPLTAAELAEKKARKARRKLERDRKRDNRRKARR